MRGHYIPEPLLEFNYGKTIEHPQDGLFLYGPVPIAGRPTAVQVGVIGTQQGIELAKRWLKEAAGPVQKEISGLYSSHWPGFQAIFGVPLTTEPVAKISLDATSIENAIKKSNRTDAVRSAVKIYHEALISFGRNEEVRPHVWLVVLPEVVYRFGRPAVGVPRDRTGSSLLSARGAARILREGSLFPDMTEEAETYLFAKNFHHQLKAELLVKEVAVQIIRETTIDPMIDVDGAGRPRRSLQDKARRLWNFSTTLYFKARGQPWQLANVRPGVCYVGLVFKQDPSPAKETEVCCAAQMFLNSGNGVVFRGALGPWRSTKTKEYHLSGAAAEDLMRTIVSGYSTRHGYPPRELFIHGKQRFTQDEWEGFSRAMPDGAKLVGVRIRQTQDMRVFRPKGSLPVVRGTAVAISDNEGYLFTTGYIPRFRSYLGFETPKPLLIDIHRGSADIFEVMKDVLALTKLNYNACDYSSGVPVTLKFADQVGEILTASPNAMNAPPLPFLYYI